MVAYLVLSHVGAAQVVRLARRIAAERDAVVFVHHDNAQDALPERAFEHVSNVHVIATRGPVTWGTFAQVEAVLDGIEAAFASGVSFDWMVLLSGQDYVCADLAAFHRALRTSDIDGFLDYAPVNEPRLRKENELRYFFRHRPVASPWRGVTARLWRLNALQPLVRFSTSRIGSFVGVADRRPFVDRQCYRGSFWWTLSRRCLAEILHVARTQQGLVAAYRQRLHPDESFFQTVLLANPDFRFINDDLRYIRWDDARSGSPAVLGTADVPAILASRRPFARKFDACVDADVLDRLDEAVSSGAAPLPVVAGVRRGATPRLSIGMPVYNGENYVADAIRSILAQTYADFELIVSDNASTDATPDIVAQFAANDRRVRFVRNAKNLGASYNFNRTFALSRGRYFRQAAHDDTLAPTCLERCMEVLENDASVALAYTRSHCIDERDQFIAEYANVMHFVSDDPVARFDAHLRRAFDRSPELNRGSNPACNPIFGIARTDMLARTPMVANYIASDMILLGEIALYGKLYEVPEALFTIRAHPSTSWAQNPSYVDVSAWFDPANRGRVISYMPHVRWFYEYLRAIQRAPLAPAQRSACVGLLLHWAADHRQAFVRESASVGARFCGLRAWAGAERRRIGPPPSIA